MIEEFRQSLNVKSLEKLYFLVLVNFRVEVS